MGYLNGQLPASALTTLGPGFNLERRAAIAWANMRHVGRIVGIRVEPVDGYGCGYRSLAVQDVYYRAARGDRDAAVKAGIDPTMHVNVAAPGYSPHGYGTRADTLFNGGVNSTTLEFASWFGWSREFGAADRYHYAHDGKTYGVAETVKNRVVADYLNGRHLGRTTTTAEDGEWPVRSNFSWMLQTAGHRDKLYPTPPYVIDGEAGARTRWLRDHYWSVLWNS
jgi:hypothetical protein